MANITVLTPGVEDKFSTERGAATVTTINDDVIVDAFANKDETLCLVFTAAGTVTIKAGNMYPNKVKGDADIVIGTAPYVCYITDKSRFQNRDGSVHIVKKAGSPALFATARRAGYLDKETADAIDNANGRGRFAN